MWIARHYHCDRPNTCLISNGFAMGIAIPGALAAKLVYPERKVVAATGDGGFMMNCQELETASRWNALVTLIFNDGGYGLIEWSRTNLGKRPMFIWQSGFCQISRQYGTKGYRVESTADFIPTLKNGLGSRCSQRNCCPVDYRELPLHPKAGDLSCSCGR